MAAIEALAQVSAEDERGALFGIRDAVRESADPSPILKALEEAPPGSLRDRTISEVAEAIAGEEIHSAAAWLDEVDMEPRAKMRAKGEVAEEWMDRHPDQFLEVLAWFIAGAPNDVLEQMMEMLPEALAERGIDMPTDLNFAR
ncbi:MAG: hypothetical protein AAF682_20155 [Planctomycetota bacterium]